MLVYNFVYENVFIILVMGPAYSGEQKWAVLIMSTKIEQGESGKYF